MWDWMTTHSYLDKSAVGRIGLWEDEVEVVGIATFDCQLGTAFCLTLPEYTYLKKEILLYAKDKLSKDGRFGVFIRDADLEFQDIAAELGFVATQEKESDSFFYLNKTSTAYYLPKGFYITTMKETFDLYQYKRVLWKGLGKAAVLEGIRRVGELGARKALVGSQQQFYYSIGFRQFSTFTLWKEE